MKLVKNNLRNKLDVVGQLPVQTATFSPLFVKRLPAVCLEGSLKFRVLRSCTVYS
jgi:hypothetical protein